MKKSNCVLFFDLEVQLSAKEVGGFYKENTRRRRFSVASTFSSSEFQLSVYLEKDVRLLAKAIKQAELVIGYNIKNFDLEVLQGYAGINLKNVKYLDLMECVKISSHKRWSLDNLLMGTFGNKTDLDGFQTIKLFKKGCIEKCIQACCNDVLSMYRLHRYGSENGIVYGLSPEKTRVSIPVQWSKLTWIP